MIGYHYTSTKRWQEIQKEGLIPQLIYNQSLIPYLADDHYQGIWCWKHELTPRDELGIVLFVAAHRASLEIVKLAVEYTEKETLDYLLFQDRRKINLTHTGNIEKLPCYLSEPQSVILTQPILPSKIQAVGAFNIMDTINNGQQYNKKER